MQVDAYTKFILTVIAFCLVVGLARDLATPAVADSGPVKVDLVRVSGQMIYNGVVPVHSR